MGDELIYRPVAPARGPAKARLTTLQKAEFIHGLDIFSQASVEELYQLASISRETDVASGQVIFTEKDPGDSFHLVIQGKVEQASEEKNTKEVFGPGEVVGLESVLTREPREATAKAVEDTFAITVEAEDLYALLSSNMEIVASIFKHFVRTLGKGRVR
ncbi:MAG: cyclic nucleotide-binding domain-containing protein [Terriglobia bacterium]|jgi:CRP-like cAMP-binding protein